jgi:hypothetical protein
MRTRRPRFLSQNMEPKPTFELDLSPVFPMIEGPRELEKKPLPLLVPSPSLEEQQWPPSSMPSWDQVTPPSLAITAARPFLKVG